MPTLDRRGFLAGAAASLALPGRVVAQEGRIVTDGAGRQVKLPGKIERVFAAGPPASILLFALAPETLVGWTSAFRAAELPFVPERYAELPVLGRLTGRGNTANIEVVLQAKPDLVFDYGTINDTFVSLADRVQAQTGIPYLLIDGRFPGIPAAFEKLGEILDRSNRGAEFAAFARAELADITTRVAAVPPERRPRVYYARGPRGLDTGLKGSINVESIEFMGAQNVAAQLGPGGLAQVSIEQVLGWNPDTIITIDPNFYAAVGQDPLWRGLRAVTSGRVFMPPSVPFGWLDFPPSVNRLIGLRWLGRVLYPEAFPEDLATTIGDFHERFYHRRPTEAQIKLLLLSLAPRPTP